MCLAFSLHRRRFHIILSGLHRKFLHPEDTMVSCVLAGIKSLHIFGRYGTEISRIYGISALHFQLCNLLNQELIAVSDSDKLLLNTSLILLCVEGNTVQPLFYFH